MSTRRWIMKAQDPAQAQTLADEIGVSPLIGQLLLNRGLSDKGVALDFVKCELSALSDPFLMLDMDRAVTRIEQALQSGEKIAIYGDYDVDGQTAVSLLVEVLRQLAHNPGLISYYIPSRIDEGYGLNCGAIRRLAELVDLVITVDCGIVSFAEIQLANELGLDVIVTDHHQPKEDVPPACAVLNPKRTGCPYPEKELAGVGIAFKLVQALSKGHSLDCHEYLDLVALGTVADLVPLLGENRVIVKHGLRKMEKTSRIGLRALMEVSGIKTAPRASDLGFKLGPRLNAVGRMGDSTRGVQLLLSTNPMEAARLARELDAENTKRQNTESQIVEQARTAIYEQGLQDEMGIVVVGEGWHPGVIGIVASRLVEEFYRPTIVISLNEGIGVGSARSIPGLNMHQGIKNSEALLQRYGGHAMAAGLTIEEQNIPEFRAAFNAFCRTNLTDEMLVPKLGIDAYLGLESVTEELIEELALLEPHGIGNPAPTLQVNTTVLEWRTVGREGKHLQCVLQDESFCQRKAIAFGFGEQAAEIERHQDNMSVAFVPGINEWNNTRSVQLQVKDLAPGKTRENYVERWMSTFPWDLPVQHRLAEILNTSEAQGVSSELTEDFRFVDLRGIWDKVQELTNRHTDSERVLILVNTAEEALELCRQLRIRIPGGWRYIAFEHQYLTAAERGEMLEMDPRWLVSTGTNKSTRKWPAVWLWKPPLNENNKLIWLDKVQCGGDVFAAFGPTDCQSIRLTLKQAFPDRSGLARIYVELRKTGDTVPVTEAYATLRSRGLDMGLPFAMQVFTDLQLWSITPKQEIVYQTSPAKKLDLNQAVLYNKGMNIRRQSSSYLKHCLERGFFQDGIKRKN